jgi:branched-chain amino acid transport system substrate-binding protein
VTDFQQRYGRVPSLYAAQGYDAAQLIASALVKTGGKVVDDKQAFRSALEAADFVSVSGPFRFDNNHFPIRNYHRVDVAADASGRPVLVNKGVVLPDHRDAFHDECRMK